MGRDTTERSGRGRLRRSLNRWASSEQAHDRDLLRETRASGCCPIEEADERSRLELHGTLRTVTLRPRGGTPALEAELYDGTGSITLVFLGRRRIGGIEPGRALTVCGRVGHAAEGPVMYNPRYEFTA
ncbi:OB-fold nucleic acid binding domain-containing protein [Nocardioidaceae bacterium]|nr:OB-fold nucleic acid binding domain-containing protein [Nocardioidaceae bacterium]